MQDTNRHGPTAATLARVDYADVYTGPVATAQLKQAVERFLFRTPAWVHGAMRLRDAIVRPLGLRTAAGAPLATPVLEVGGRIGPFVIYELNDSRAVAGDDDKHLSFRVLWTLGEVDAQRGTARLAVRTEVQFHSWLGRLYFVPVKVGHGWVVQSMLRRAAD